MKSFKEFLSESINISGNASVGTIVISGQSAPEPEPVGEQFVADVVWEGKLYRMEILADRVPSRESLGEQIQGNYPGAVVHNIYPAQHNLNNGLKITDIKRYQPERLTWTD